MSELHEETKRALRMLGSVTPPEGMEARVAARVRECRAELSVGAGESGNLWRWSLVAAGALAIAAVVFAGRHHATGVAPQVVETRPQVLPVAPPVVVEVEHVRRHVAPVRHAAMLAASQVAPPLPLTPQEKLLLSLAQRPRPVTGLDSVARSETVVDHGLGENAIFELDHEELAQLKTTLQPAPLKNTLPQLNHPGDIE